MAKLSTFVFVVAFALLLVAPGKAMAGEPHSWCVTGVKMVNPPDSSTDENTKAVVVHVCGMTGFEDCCKTRWSLACVQRAADWARSNNLDGGDTCGRFAWVQGRIRDTQQYYPRDFNLFTVGDSVASGDSLDGDVTAIMDSEGPIATRGDIRTSSFNINWGQRQPVALVSQGSFGLSNGSVRGLAYYGQDNTSPREVFPRGQEMDPVKAPDTIPFAEVSTKLQKMSKAIGAYTPTAGTSANYDNDGSLRLKGTDPEMNVIFVAASKFANRYKYIIDVPANSHVIINVTGTSATLQYAQVDRLNGLTANRILWNFPDATSLLIQSVFLPGSVLAPLARAELKWGQIGGTVVVKRGVPTSAEIHWAPYTVPSIRGCTSLFDKNWNCSTDTYLDDRGQVSVSAPEAGFMQFDGGTYTSEGATRTSPTHRIWYSFQPAPASPETKPLAVLFNGGPGAATSAFMFALNTGPSTLDPATTKGQAVVANPNSWTQFANLLYIDAPGTGFSYPMALDDNSKPSVGIDLDRDAALVLRVVLKFLDKHPIVRSNRVILVGESYGGTRAVLMLDKLLQYQNLIDTSSAFRDRALYDEIVAHFSFVLPGPTSWTAEQIASQFSHQALIQPAVMGNIQYAWGYVHKNESGCHASPYDTYQCDEAENWYMPYVKSAADKLANLNNLVAMLNVDVKSIKWMYASERTKAYGRDPYSDINGPSVIIDTSGYRSIFGTLASGDNYLVMMNARVSDAWSDTQHGYPGGRWWTDNWIGRTFFNVVTVVRTFITNTAFDMAIYSPAIPNVIMSGKSGSVTYWSDMVASYEWDQSPRDPWVRPGFIDITYSSAFNGIKREIRFPYYAAAGHTVVIRQPAEVMADIRDWYDTTQVLYGTEGGGAGSGSVWTSPVRTPSAAPLPMMRE